jgi:heme/copper-type cytochrome/quinol oxidase subunit 4
MSLAETVGNGLSAIGKASGMITLVLGIVFGLVVSVVGFALVLNSSIVPGLIVILFGVLIMVIATMYYYLVMNNDTASKIAGVATIWNILDGGRMKNALRKRLHKE